MRAAILLTYFQFRAVGRSENPGVPVLFGGHSLPHLVEIGLTDPHDNRPEHCDLEDDRLSSI